MDIKKKVQPLVMLSGKESDYEIVVYARALCDFNSDVQIGEFKKRLDPDRDPPYAQQRMFLLWATKAKLIEITDKVVGTSWWLGAYGALNDWLRAAAEVDALLRAQAESH